MWDGRESASQTATAAITSDNYPGALLTDLAHQATTATLGHAQALAAPTADQQDQIVRFELGLSTAQAEDDIAGTLSAEGAKGGPEALAGAPFHVGINDVAGWILKIPYHSILIPNIFNVFDAWGNTKDANRQAIYRGQVLFNTRTFTIWGVDGLNDNTFPTALLFPTLLFRHAVCHNVPIWAIIRFQCR